MKTCKDCKFNRPDWLFRQIFAKCAATPDPVTGKPKWYCETERNPFFDSISSCGSKGNLWEQKKSLIERFMHWIGK